MLNPQKVADTFRELRSHFGKFDWKKNPVLLCVCDGLELSVTAFTGVHAYPSAERAYNRAVRDLKMPVEFRIYEKGALVLFDQAEPRAPELH